VVASKLRARPGLVLLKLSLDAYSDIASFVGLGCHGMLSSARNKTLQDVGETLGVQKRIGQF
jgi:hypothetical protein